MKNAKKLIVSAIALAAIFMIYSFKSSNPDKITTTTDKKVILLIGIDPKLIDFSSPEYAAFPGLTAEKVDAGVKAQQSRLKELGYESELCWIDFGQTASAVILEKLKSKKFDGVLIGAGIRVPQVNFILFEKIINMVHQNAAQARIIFNTNPKDTVEAVQRWL